jgi:AraC family transcriptional regulator of adaptative response/methylated-DNA-[protein]-cysteine methyltransferase
MKTVANRINRLTEEGFQQWLKSQAQFGYAETLLGRVSLCFDETSVSRLSFTEESFQDLSQSIRRNDQLAQQHAESIFQSAFTGSITLIATDFQLVVWQALMRVPFGEVISYQGLAESIGRPTAFRAVATAIAQNRCGFLNPCHRVIKKNGESGEFRWGAEMKRRLLDWEAQTKR